jgi:hypothetical protein
LAPRRVWRSLRGTDFMVIGFLMSRAKIML